MYMKELIDELCQQGIRVTPPTVRHAEMLRHIPACRRDYRGFRQFDSRHVKGMAKWLGNRRQQQPAA